MTYVSINLLVRTGNYYTRLGLANHGGERVTADDLVKLGSGISMLSDEDKFNTLIQNVHWSVDNDFISKITLFSLIQTNAGIVDKLDIQRLKVHFRVIEERFNHVTTRIESKKCGRTECPNACLYVSSTYYFTVACNTARNLFYIWEL